MTHTWCRLGMRERHASSGTMLTVPIRNRYGVALHRVVHAQNDRAVACDGDAGGLSKEGEKLVRDRPRITSEVFVVGEQPPLAGDAPPQQLGEDTHLRPHAYGCRQTPGAHCRAAGERREALLDAMRGDGPQVTHDVKNVAVDRGEDGVVVGALGGVHHDAGSGDLNQRRTKDRW